MDRREFLKFAFKSIRAKDAVCVGVYTKDQPHQIREDSDLTRKLTIGISKENSSR